MSIVKHWKSATRLTLIIYDSSGTATSYPLVPIDSLRISERSDKEIRDGLSQGNQQKIHKWHRYTFDLRLPAVVDNVGALVWLQKHDQDFDLRISEYTNESGTDLVIKNVSLSDCSIENMEYAYSSNDVPVLSITGIAMNLSAVANAQEIEVSRGSSADVPSALTPLSQ